MLQAAITGERQAGLVDVPDPSPKEHWALVKVQIAPMCTEYKAFVAGHRSDRLGHEAVGEVVAVAQPCRVGPGDRVIVQPQYACGRCPLCIAGDYIHCRANTDFVAFTGSPHGSATMTQLLLKPDWLLTPIPDDLSDERAALALCALGPSLGAFERIGLTGFDTVVITGLGPVGLGGVVNAAFRGARVIGVEPNPWRAERARELGAQQVLDPGDGELVPKLLELTGGVGADAGLDCSGTPAAHRLLLDAVRRRGRVACVGECFEETPLRVSNDLIRKGLTLVGSWHYNLNLVPQMLHTLRHAPGLNRLVSHVFPMSRLQEAFETLAGQQTAKVLLKPWE